MNSKTYPAMLHRVLEPEGFRRDGMNWIRVRGDMQEMVDIQVSAIHGVTANFYMKDLETEKLLLEAIPWMRPNAIIVEGTRIGELIDGGSRWWRRDPNGPAELAEAVRTYGLPYFDSVRTLEEQAAQWYGRGNLSRGWHAPSRIYLALTLYRLGEVKEACEALANPPKRLIEAWRPQVESVRQWLGCDRTT